MNITKAGKFNHDLGYVLDKLQDKLLYATQGKILSYSILHRADNLPLSPEHEIAIIEMLASWKVLEIEERKDTPDLTVFDVNIIQKKFSELYKIFQNAKEENFEPEKLHRLIKEWSGLFPVDEMLRFDIYRLKHDKINKKKSTILEDEIEYNPTTGKGIYRSKEFTLKDGSAEYRVFSKLYEKINNKISRYDVLLLLHFYEDGENMDPGRKTSETAAINNVAKSLRTKIGLNSKELSMNGGNLTLLGNKTTKPNPN